MDLVLAGLLLKWDAWETWDRMSSAEHRAFIDPATPETSKSDRKFVNQQQLLGNNPDPAREQQNKTYDLPDLSRLI